MFRTIGLLSQRRRIAALFGGAEPLLDLEFAVDPESDHARGPRDAPVTVVEYGHFECRYCGRAEPAVRELLRDFADVRYRLGLDVARFTEELQGHVGGNRIAQDVEGADLSRVSGTPTFFINGRRHHGAYDIDHLSRAVRAAGARAKLAAS